MKQNIECVECAPKWLALLRQAVLTELGNGRTQLVQHYPDTGEETMTLQAGTARQEFKCDSCAERIEEGADCFAVSVYAPDAGIPNLPGWERGYIRVPLSVPRIHHRGEERGLLLFIPVSAECDGQEDSELDGWARAVIDNLKEDGLRLTQDVEDASAAVDTLQLTLRGVTDMASKQEQRAVKAEEAARLAEESKRAWQHKGAEAQREAEELRRELGLAGQSVDLCHDLLVAMREAGAMKSLDPDMAQRVAQLLASDVEETQTIDAGSQS